MAKAEDLRAKLERLRGDARARASSVAPAGASRRHEVPPGPTPDEAAGPSSQATSEEVTRTVAQASPLPERLRARLGRSSGVGAVAPLSSDPRTSGPPESLAVEQGPLGEYVARTTTASTVAAHGAWTYDEALDVDADAFALLTGDATLAGVDLGRALFVDTETTGLEGGAGTYVFLVGLGWFEGERFVVQQSFLRDPSDEPALLGAVAERIARSQAVVSFFGKVFDRHRLEDKMRVHGVAPPFAGRPHLDLCFPLRRLTKGAYPDGRLATLERQLVGVARSDDLPGSLAPAAWFDFLAGRAHRLEGVFRHNLDDVRSLATLAAYLGRVPAGARRRGAPLAGPSAHRAFALARAHAQRRDVARALEAYAQLLADPGAPALGERALARARDDVQRLERRLARGG